MLTSHPDPLTLTEFQVDVPAESHFMLDVVNKYMQLGAVVALDIAIKRLDVPGVNMDHHVVFLFLFGLEYSVGTQCYFL